MDQPIRIYQLSFLRDMERLGLLLVSTRRGAGWGSDDQPPLPAARPRPFELQYRNAGHPPISNDVNGFSRLPVNRLLGPTYSLDKSSIQHSQRISFDDFGEISAQDDELYTFSFVLYKFYMATMCFSCIFRLLDSSLSSG